MTKIKQVIAFLEEKAPLSLQESYDNSGLLIGDENQEVQSLLVCLDITNEVLDEAISKNCNLIVAHHPLIFSGIKKLTGKTYVEKLITKAIKNDLAIYAIHTNLDNVRHGVNEKFAEKLKLSNCKILQAKSGSLCKLVTYCPKNHLEEVKTALFEKGAGQIGNYDHCSFQSSGIGTFRANEQANPFVGKSGIDHHEEEFRLEVVIPSSHESAIIEALLNSHPYEEVAYDIIPIKNKQGNIGAGLIGELNEALNPNDFLAYVKKSMNLEMIRYTAYDGPIKKIAICGGSGSFLIQDAIKSGAQAFITGDFKYHQFFDAENRLLIADIGHYESEKYTIELLEQWLSEKFANFAVIFTETNTNPVKYYA